MISTEDLALAEASVRGVTRKDIDAVIRVHEAQIKRNEARRQELLKDLESIDRALALRTHALFLLRKMKES